MSFKVGDKVENIDNFTVNNTQYLAGSNFEVARVIEDPYMISSLIELKTPCGVQLSSSLFKLYTGFIKHSKDKIQTTLIDPFFLEDLAQCLTKGAVKYAPDNWKLARNGLKEYSEAMDRHLLGVKKYLATGDVKHLIDEDSGDQQGFALGANAMFLHWFIEKELRG